MPPPLPDALPGPHPGACALTDRSRHPHGGVFLRLFGFTQQGTVDDRVRDDVAVDVPDRIVLGHEHLPFDDADRHVHAWQRHLDVAFLAERRAGMEIDERHLVRAVRTEARAQERHARAIRAEHRLRGCPATSTDTIVAPGGSATFRNGCARFCT